MHGHNNNANDCAHIMHVMAAYARARVAAFEKAQALMKRTLRVTKSIRKLLGRDGDVSKRAGWLTLTPCTSSKIHPNKVNMLRN